MSYPKVYFDPMYLSPRPSRRRQVEPKRRLYPVEAKSNVEIEADEEVEFVQTPSRSRYKRRVQVVAKHVPVEPTPYSDFLPFFPDEPTPITKPKPEPPVVTAAPVSKSEPDPQISPFREHVQPTPQKLAPVKKTRKRKVRANHVLLVMASIVFVVGIGTALLGLKTNDEVQGQVQGASAQSDDPNETAPGLGAHVVAPHLPRYITITRLGVKSRVVKVSANAQNQLKAPSNIHDAGWYENSALPGDAGGAMLLDGHAHGPTKPGIFDKLEQLQAGDLIEIERGDGQKFSFSVVRTQSFDQNSVDMASAMVSADSAKLGLNLITCSGSYNSQTGEYDQRHIVYAVAI